VIETITLKIRNIAIQDLPKRIPMQKADMVALMESIHEDLPVHGLADHALVVECPVVKLVEGKLRTQPTQPRVDIELSCAISSWCGKHPYQTIFLAQWKGNERGSVGTHPRKAALVRNTHHLAG